MSGICIKLDPENAVYLDTYAWIYFMQGNYVLARIYIEKAIANDTSLSGDLFDHYGDILYMSGDHEGAIRQWERAIEAGKSNATLQRKVAEKIYINTPEDEK
jgi:tetratricopeptide (TPR) repeat protein